MTDREMWIRIFKEAVLHRNFEMADDAFQHALEAGAVELDQIEPGSGDVWRNLGKSMSDLVDDVMSHVGADKRSLQ